MLPQAVASNRICGLLVRMQHGLLPRTLITWLFVVLVRVRTCLTTRLRVRFIVQWTLKRNMTVLLEALFDIVFNIPLVLVNLPVGTTKLLPVAAGLSLVPL